MPYISEIKEPLRKALEIIKKDRHKFARTPWKELNAENLENAAGNHLFDDLYLWFGFEKIEGHIIRSYFQTGAFNGYDFIVELHKAFPDLMEPEKQDYLDRVNEYRARHCNKLPIIQTQTQSVLELKVADNKAS